MLKISNNQLCLVVLILIILYFQQGYLYQLYQVMSEVYGLSTLPLIEKADQNLSLYALQTNLLKIWTEKKVDKYYQTAVLAYLDNLSQNQAKQEIVKEQQRLIQNKSQFNKIQQYVRHRQEVLDIIEQMLEDEQQLEDACQSLDELRKINLKLCECIFQMKESLQSRGLNGNSICQGYNQMFKNLESDNINIIQSYLKKYIPFGKGYDPFFLVPYERIQKQSMEDIPKCVSKLFKMNISYVYRLIKAKNQIIKCLSCSCVTGDDKISNESPLMLRPKVQKQNKYDSNNEGEFGSKYSGQKKLSSEQRTQERTQERPQQKLKQKKPEDRKQIIEEPDSEMGKSSGYIKSKFKKIGDQQQIDEPPVITKARQIEEKHKKKSEKKIPVKLPHISKSADKPGIKNSGSRLTIKKNRIQGSPNIQQINKEQSEQDEIDAYRKKIILRKMKRSSKNIDKGDIQKEKEKKKSAQPKGGSIKKQTPRDLSRNQDYEEEGNLMKEKSRDKRKSSKKRPQTNTIDVDRRKNSKRNDLNSDQSQQGNMSSQVEPSYFKKSGAYQSDSNYRQKKLNPNIRKDRVNTQQSLNDRKSKDKDYNVWKYDNRNSKSNYQSQYSPYSMGRDNRRHSQDNQSPHQIHHRYGIHNPQYCEQCRMDEQDNQYRKNRKNGKGYQNNNNFRQGEPEDIRFRDNYRGGPRNNVQYQNQDNFYSSRPSINGHNRGYPHEKSRNYPYDHNGQGQNNRPGYDDGYYNRPYYNNNSNPDYRNNNNNNLDNRNSYRSYPQDNQNRSNLNKDYPKSPYNNYENNNPRNRQNENGTNNDYRNLGNYRENQIERNPNNNLNSNRNPNYNDKEMGNNPNPVYRSNQPNNFNFNQNPNPNFEEQQKKGSQNNQNFDDPNKKQNSIKNQNYSQQKKPSQHNQNQPNQNQPNQSQAQPNQNIGKQDQSKAQPAQNLNKPNQRQIQGQPNQTGQKPANNLNIKQKQKDPSNQPGKNTNGTIQKPIVNDGNNPPLEGKNSNPQKQQASENKNGSPEKKKQVKSTNPAQLQKSSPTKREIQMKPGQIKVNQLFKFISEQKIPQQYRSEFERNLWKQNITNRHSYMTKFFLNSELAAFGISSPRNDGDYSILYWGVMVNNDKIGTAFLFKRYLQYLEKFTSLNNIYIDSSKYQNMEFVQQGNNYVKKRSLSEKKQLSYVPFLSIQCSNICFNEGGDINHSTFFSQEIQSFSTEKSSTCKQIGLIQRSQKLPSKMKIHQNIPNILEINKLLQKYEADTYAATQQIKTGSCKLIVLKDNLTIKSNDFYVRDGFFMTKGLLIHSQSTNEGKPSVVFKMELQKNNIHVFFGKNFAHIQQFTKICNYKSQGKVKNFAFKMFTKQLYGRMKNPDFTSNGCYGNWDIDFVWQDQLKGVVIKQMPSNDSIFGPENFFISIFKDNLLLYGFQINSNDFVF